MPAAFEPPRPVVVDVVTRALTEDLVPLGDLTCALLPDDLHTSASFVAREPGVLAGTACAREVFAQLDAAVSVRWECVDGDVVEPGTVIGVVDGPVASVLTGERSALNFLGHLSGVASLTRRFVDAVGAAAGNSPAPLVWDTRKTTPGLRSVEKAAVRAGGGANHRGNLSDWVLLKDNHLAIAGITETVTTARGRWPGRTIHVECDRFDQVVEAVAAGADALLLDNMTPDEVRRCVAHVRSDDATSTGPHRPLLEVSGGITLESIGSYATTGVDCISVGAITNSATVLDIGLDIPIEPAS